MKQPRGTLGERLWTKIDTSAGPKGCWPFRGAHSRSGRRKTRYPIIREAGQGSHRWRVGRLLLVLAHGLIEVPPVEGEVFLVWLARARRYYHDLDLEASHECDHSECANPDHLVWETHAENLARQRARQQKKLEAA